MDSDDTLPMRCPRCQHPYARLVASGLTVVTVCCASCQHCWTAVLAMLPDDAREAVRQVLRDRKFQG